MIRSLLLLLGLISLSATSQTIDDFSFTDIDGLAYNLYSNLEQNKPVGIYFFFVDCGFCQTSTPELQSYLDNIGSDCIDIIALSVNQSDTESQIQAYKTSKNADYRFFTSAGTNGEVFSILQQSFGNSVNTPSFILVNPDKTIQSEHMGLSALLANVENDMTSLVSDVGCQTAVEDMDWQDIELVQTSGNTWSIFNPLSEPLEIALLSADGRHLPLPASAPGWTYIDQQLNPGLYWLSISNAKKQVAKAIISY